MTKSPFGLVGPFDAPGLTPLRNAAATALRMASVTLTRVSRQLRAAHRLPYGQRPPELEFYAEAGAPEGALYVDGRYVGHVPGVNRL